MSRRRATLYWTRRGDASSHLKADRNRLETRIEAAQWRNASVNKARSAIPTNIRWLTLALGY